MHEIKAIVRPDRLERILDSLHGIADLPGITVSTVTGYGRLQPPTDGVHYGKVGVRAHPVLQRLGRHRSRHRQRPVRHRPEREGRALRSTPVVRHDR